MFGIVLSVCCAFRLATNRIHTIPRSNIDAERVTVSVKSSLALCVVGQLQRLEVESKVRNLVHVNSELGVDIAVFGVLDSGSARYTNPNQGGLESLDRCYHAKIPERNIVGKATTEFLNAGAKHVDIYVSPPNQFELTSGIWHWARRYRDPNEREHRLQNHLRIYKHDAECAEMILSHEEVTNSRFDVILRMRDNAIVYQPLTLRTMREQFKDCVDHGQCIVSKGCSSWGGYSDKFWVIPRKLLLPALTKGFSDLINASEFLQQHAPENSEKLLRLIWEHHGVPRRDASKDQLPVVDGRCTLIAETSRDAPIFLPVDQRKDCSSDVFWKYQGIPPSPIKVQYTALLNLMDDALLTDGTPEISDDEESSYGFYYPTPFSFDGKFYVSVIRSKATRTSKLSETVTVAVYRTEGKELIRRLGTTSAHNVPFGPRAQFIGKGMSVIYNYGSTEHNFTSFHSKVVDVESGETVASLQYPVFSLSADGTRATSLDYARTSVFTAEGTYGYPISEAQGNSYLIEDGIPDDDGIWVMNPLSKSTRRLIVTPRIIVDHVMHNNFTIYSSRKVAGTWLNSCYVWLEQPRLDDSGSRIIFMARAKCPEAPIKDMKVMQRIPYLNIGVFTIGWNGENLWYAAGAPTSHFDFAGTGPGELLLCGNEGMWLTQDRLGGGTLFVSNDLLRTGHALTDRYAGHCSMSRTHPHIIVTDTSCTACTIPCPVDIKTCREGERGRQLGFLDVQTGVLTSFAWFEADVTIPEPQFVDLHPRFSPGDKYLSIDSAHDYVRGSRQYIIDLEAVRNFSLNLA